MVVVVAAKQKHIINGRTKCTIHQLEQYNEWATINPFVQLDINCPHTHHTRFLGRAAGVNVVYLPFICINMSYTSNWKIWTQK